MTSPSVCLDMLFMYSAACDVLHRCHVLPVAVGADRGVDRDQAVGVVGVVLPLVNRGVERRGVVDLTEVVHRVRPVGDVQIRPDPPGDRGEEIREEAAILDLGVDVVLVAVREFDDDVG